MTYGISSEENKVGKLRHMSYDGNTLVRLTPFMTDDAMRTSKIQQCSQIIQKLHLYWGG